MSFENQERYRRKPDLVQAVRLTAEGNVPITHADADWIKRALADKRLQWTGTQYFVNVGSIYATAAYPGDWLTLHDDGRLEALTDGRFREMYEAIPFEEDE